MSSHERQLEAASIARGVLLEAGFADELATERGNNLGAVALRVIDEDPPLIEDVMNVLAIIGLPHCPGPRLSLEGLEVLACGVVAALKKEGFE